MANIAKTAITNLTVTVKIMIVIMVILEALVFTVRIIGRIVIKFYRPALQKDPGWL